MRVAIVANPVSGGGRARRHLPAIRAAVSARISDLTVVETTGPGDAARLGAEFTRAGYGLVIAMGGDGTVSEVADGMLSAARADGIPLPDFAFIAAGTGMDFRRNFSVPADPVQAALAILDAPVQAVDVGLVEFSRADGSTTSRHFLNVASVGLSGVIAASVNEAKAKGSKAGIALYILHSAREILRFKAQRMRVLIDGETEITGPVGMLAVANGGWFGGGMRLAPEARVNDGAFELVVLRPQQKLLTLWHMVQIITGGHCVSENIICARGQSVLVAAEPGVGPGTGGGPDPSTVFEMDGETETALSARYSILPGALRLRA